MQTHPAGDVMALPELDLDAWKTLLDHSSDYVYVIDRNLIVRWANARAVDYLGEDVVGASVDSLAIHRFGWTRELIEEVLTSGLGRDIDDQFELEGRLVALELTFLPFGPRGADGTVSYVGVCIRNVSDFRRQLHQVQQLEQRAQHLVENALDLVFVITHDLELSKVSANVEEVLGWNAERIQGMHAYTLLHPDDIVPAMQAVRAAIEHPGTSVATRLRVRDRNGRVRTLDVRGRSVDDRIIVHAREVSSDLGDIEYLRQSLSHADRLASIGRLTAGVAHEINNPASFVLTNLFVEAELLDELRAEMNGQFDGDESVNTLIKELGEIAEANRRGLQRIQAIVRNLRSFARDEAPATTDVDIGEVLEFALAIVEPRAASAVDVDRQCAETPTVPSDRSQLVQVAVNLLTNALDAVEGRDDPAIVIRCDSDAESVWFEVADNGPGIDEDVAPEIFAPFFTTKPREKGTGLGLWLCAEMIDRLGGTISVGASEAGGASFRVTLPRELEIQTTDEEHA